MTFHFRKLTVGFIGALSTTLAVGAYAATTLLTSPPSVNSTVPNFNALTIGSTIETNGTFYSDTNGVVNQTHIPTQPISLNAGQILSSPPFALRVNSSQGGIKGAGPSIGIQAQGIKTPAENLFARVGVEGRVVARQPNNSIGTARGFAGYLQYLPISVAENSLNLTTLTGYHNGLVDDFVRLSRGLPWAFFTEDRSKFRGDLEITGTVAGAGVVNFAPPSTSSTVPVVTVQGGDVTTPDLTVDDYVSTDNLENEFSKSTASVGFQSSTTNFSATVACPANSIRLGCSGGAIDSTTAPGYAPYLGVQPVGINQCTAYGRRPAGTVPGNLNVFAYCWTP